MSDSTFDAALGRVPSGIFILTVGDQQVATGMLASWVMQAGFEPPMLSVAVKQGRYVGDWLTEGKPFVLNVVGEKQGAFLKHFGRGFDLGQPAFTGLSVEYDPRGVPLLVDAVGHLQCEPASHVDSGDHRIFLAKVVGGQLAADDRPMVHIRSSGAHY